MTTSECVCSICARGGSISVPNKNLKLLGGKPLIAHSIEHAKKSGLFMAVIVDTDSDEIATVSKAWGADMVFKRPSELAHNESPKLPAIRHAFLASESYFNKKFSFHVDLDATSPLRSIEDIQNAVTLFLSSDADNLITASPARRSPYFNLIERDECGRVVLSKPHHPPLVRRQDAPQCFDMNASIYIWKRECLLTQNTLFLPKTVLYEMPEARSIDIDSELDFMFVDYLIQRKGS